MKRIYKDFSYGKELIGYDYKGYFIEIEDEFNGSKSLLGTTKKWYYITLKSGERCCFDKLYEAKERIDNDEEV